MPRVLGPWRRWRVWSIRGQGEQMQRSPDILVFTLLKSTVRLDPLRTSFAMKFLNFLNKLPKLPKHPKLPKP